MEQTVQVDATEKNRKRKKIDRRLESIMEVATELFIENGYEGTSLNAILERVGGSKRNFYTKFDGKEGLFKVLVERNIQHLLEEQIEEDREERDLRATLLSVAKRQIRVFGDPKMLGLYRIAVRDGINFPEIARAFLEAGPETAVGYVAATLERFARKGELASCETTLAAYHFISMLHGRMFYELFFDTHIYPSKQEVEAFIESVVELFLYGVLKRTKDDARE